MTVSAQTPINSSTGNGVTTVFPYTFKVIQAADIQVLVNNVAKVLNVDYTVSGVGVDAGGNVTFAVAPSNLTTVVRQRSMALTRTTDYQDQGELPAATLDNDIDATVLMMQQVDAKTARSMLLPVGSAASAVLPTPSAGALLGWTAAADALQNYTGGASAPVSLAMAPVVAGATLAAARAAMGVSDVSSLNLLAAINGGQIAGFRNRIHNGGFQVDQRNAYAAQTITAGAALAYTADRWYAYCTGANVTGQVVAGSAQSQKRYQFTGAASVTAIGLGTRLEARDTYDLNSQTVTIAADLANSLLTTVTWTLSRATTTDDTFGTLAAPTVTQIATGTFTVNSTVSRYSAQVSVPAAATTGLQLVFSVGAQTSGTWTIGDVQLELGSTASAFERRSFAAEQAMCQRYLPAFIANGSSQPVGFGWAKTTSTGNFFFNYLVAPRAVPTGVTIVGGVGSFSLITSALHGGAPSGSYVATSITLGSQTGLQMAQLDATATGAPYTANQPAYLTADGVARILFNGCEL